MSDPVQNRPPYLDEYDRLTFVASPTRVHVEVPVRPEDVDPARKHPDWGLTPLSDGVLALAAIPYRRTLCGKIGFGGAGEGWERVPHFPDEKLCAACHRLMGEDAVRVFEQNQPPRDPESAW